MSEKHRYVERWEEIVDEEMKRFEVDGRFKKLIESTIGPLQQVFQLVFTQIAEMTSIEPPSSQVEKLNLARCCLSVLAKSQTDMEIVALCEEYESQNDQ